MSSTETSGYDLGIGTLIDGLESGVLFVLRVIKWILSLAFAAAWLAFSLNFVRIHLAMGDIDDAALTTVVFIGPLVVVALWVAFEKSAAVRSTADSVR